MAQASTLVPVTKMKKAQARTLALSWGLISTYYLANFDHQIKRAVFSAPFFGMPLKHPVRDEMLLSLMMLFGQGKRYVFGKGPYKPVDVQENLLSHDSVPLRWRKRPRLCL